VTCWTKFAEGADRGTSGNNIRATPLEYFHNTQTLSLPLSWHSVSDQKTIRLRYLSRAKGERPAGKGTPDAQGGHGALFLSKCGESSTVKCLQETLRRLAEIERAIGVLDSLSVKRMVIDAQDYILESQKESGRTARSNDPRIDASK
jgi:hypothetical protein